jgi:hypothetical protein
MSTTISFSLIDSSPIRYHQVCIAVSNRLCFRDDIYLCLCTENHTRAECFLYDDELDQCEHCLGNQRCLTGHPRRSNDFLCLNSSRHSEQHTSPTPNYSGQNPNSTPNYSPSVLAICFPLMVSLLIFSLLTDKGTILF